MAITETDIKLLPIQVKFEAYDLCLDCMDPDRRKNDTEHRRALVHDFEDGLTMNWAEDYPGGVTINAVHKITGRPSKSGWSLGERIIEIESTIISIKAQDGHLSIHTAAINLDNDSAVNINGKAQFTDEVAFTGKAKVSRVDHQPNMGPILMEYDLFEEITTLRKRVAELEKKDHNLVEEISKLRKAIGKLNKKVGIA